MDLIATKDAARKLRITVARVHQLIKSGQLPAQKIGRDVFVLESDLEKLKDRKVGRPKKKAA